MKGAFAHADMPHEASQWEDQYSLPLGDSGADEEPRFPEDRQRYNWDNRHSGDTSAALAGSASREAAASGNGDNGGDPPSSSSDSGSGVLKKFSRYGMLYHLFTQPDPWGSGETRCLFRSSSPRRRGVARARTPHALDSVHALDHSARAPHAYNVLSTA